MYLTCYKLCEQLVVAVDDVDRYVSGRLQEQRAALQRERWTGSVILLQLCVDSQHQDPAAGVKVEL